MRTTFFFATHGDDQIAGAASFPDGEPLGLALLLVWNPPLGLIGSNFWSHAAAKLVERGIACVRFDYLGTGDSTGLVREWRLPTRSDTEQALAVAHCVLDELPFDTFAVAGACYNARVALEVARDPSCVGAVCIDPPLAGAALLGKAAHTRLASIVRGNATLRRLVKSALSRRASRPARAALEHALGHARVLMLYDDDRLSGKGLWMVDPLANGREPNGDYELQREASVGVLNFDRLELSPPEVRTLDTIVDWLVSCCEAVPQPQEPASPRRAVAAPSA